MSLYEHLVSEHIVHLQKNLKGSQWENMREEAMKIFEAKGFPDTKNEEWRFTNLRPIIKENFELFPDSEKGIDYPDVKKYFLHDIDSYKLVFLNGVYSSYLSQTTHDEADICVLSSALQKGMHQTVIENYFNKAVPNDESLPNLNTAYFKDGAYIYIPNNVVLSQPIQILFFSTADEANVMFHPRNLVVLGDNAQAQIIERHQTLNSFGNLTNSVTEIYVGKNSHLDYYKVQNDAENASLIDHTFIEQERDSVASVHTFSLGGKLIRNGLNFKQKGENCNSILNGITLAEGDQHIDHHTKVDHISPNCESHELYRTILDGNSKGVFNGKVIVEPEAQKIDAFQQNNNILLTNTASIDTKPQLEIFADDVKCSHGCTVGQLDEEAMFYMQSRGIPKKEARALLLYAFSADVIENVKLPQIKERITRLIAKKLGVEMEF